MILSEISIKRPVLAIVISLLVLLVGFISYDRLTLREYPHIDVPVVTVDTSYTGASATIIESQVTKIIEDSLSGIEGIDFMSSISRSERSQITINFRIDRDPDAAANDVRDRVSRVRGQLPDDIDEPIVAKSEADAQPIIWIALSSDVHDPMEVTDFAQRRVRDPLQTVSGVASVRMGGERRYAMRLWLDPDKMAAYEVIPQDIEAALSAQNIELPAGRIESKDREFTILAQTDLNDTEEFEQIIIRQDGDYLVRVADVARVDIAPEASRNHARFNGVRAQGLGIVRQSTANPLDVSAGVREMLSTIEPTLPEGMKIQVAYDSSVFIERSIESVYETLIMAGLLVVVVIFFFLRNLRATLIPVVTIPLSLIGAFAMMYLLNFSINTLTLLALVLAIGLVVDDAIVMLENIFRHVEEGLHPIQAAFKGSKEIGFAIVATTATLVAVFVPVSFSSGQTGRLFTEFALTLAGAVVVSTFIALTLAPMLCSRLLHHEKKHSAIFNLIEGWLVGLSNGYHWLLEKTLNGRIFALALMLVSLAGAGYFYTLLPQELAPVEDRGTIMTFSVNPDGSSVEYVNRYAKQVEAIISGIPERTHHFAITGFPSETNSLTFVRLEDWENRTRSQQEVAAELTGKLYSGVPGNMSFAINLPSLGQSFISRPVEFVIKTTGDYDDLKVITDKMLAKIAENENFQQVDTDLKLNKPELRLTLNREKVAEAGLSVAEVGRSLETYMSGRTLTRFKRGGEQYDVILQIEDSFRETHDDLSKVYVRSAAGEMIQLGNLITVEETVAPRELNHFDKLKAVKIESMLAPDYSLGDALDYLEASLAEIAPDALFDYAGQSREFRESANTMQVTFILSLIFIFLVLAAQFESFKNPLIIMLAVPPALAGGLIALFYSGGSLNIYSQIGLITLVGLVTKHGILIVEFANQLQDKGMELKEAIIEAASLRLRPILMTTGATVLGTLPLALAVGAGAESRHQIGWVIVGGMMLGTVLTLFVIPTIYSIFGKRNFKVIEPDYEI
ncbi:efflux RND transporter permease subunit [Nitrincola iocasae]|jgi:multidrug efflux pump|uniref:Efflux RND transporter permease subunit n=1 Tax=Nitrincola iocasae TaxID=2614693 RepID=A0A5J6LCN1_9GAMM|nr:efflux RND transporter permease subunit [Nitrincola iocasae]QEW06293.1 efflux RND transporter permease subunit [Nitrincola iocasae]